MAKRTFKNTTTPLSVFARNGNNGWIESAKENQHFNTYDDYIAAVANDKGYSDSEKAYVYNDNFVKDVTKGEKPQGDQAYVNYSHNHNDRTLKGDTKKGTDYDDSELAKKIDTYGINDTTVTSKDVNKFFKDSQSFFEKQQEKAGSTSWKNASENYSQFDKKYNKLKKKAYDVSHFLSQNKDNMKEKDYQEAIDYIHSVRKNGKALADAYKSAETYYSQFDSAKEARKAEMGWGANTSESNMTKDKIAKRQDYYNQTQSAIRELDAKIAQKEQIVNASQNNKSATYGMYNSDNNLPSYSMYNPDVSASMALRDLATLKAERDNLLRDSQTYERNQKQFDDNQTILNSKEYQKSLKSYNIDSSNDKLNTYLRNKNHIGSALENQRNGIASSEDLALIEGNQSGWDMLTESEIQTYNSILSAQGDDAAYKWLDDMKNIIDQRITQSVVDDYSNGSGLEKVITNLGTVPMSVVGGIGSAVSDVYNLANGNDITPYDSMHFAQNLTTGIRSETSEEIDKLTGGAKAPISGMTLGGAYQAVMSGIDSLAGASMFGTGYTGLMSMGAFSSTAKDLYERGASNEQIAWGSMLAGAAEYVFEKVSIENFLKTTDTRSKLAIMKQILKQGGVEASEEFATELANIVSDYFVMGDGSNFSEWISDGGLKHAFAQAGLQAIEAAEGGFLSGAGMAGLGSTGNYHSYNSQMTQVGKDFFPTAYGLLDSETGIEGLDTKRASKAMESIKSGKNSNKNFRELGKLVNSAEEILREKATKESIKAQLSVERNQRGDETEVTDSEVDKVYKQLNNNAEWSRSDKLTRQRVEQFRSERTGEVNRKVQEALAEIASNSAKKIAKDETVETVTNSIADKVNEESGHNIEEVLSTSRVDNKTVLNMKDDNGNTVKSGEIEYANRKQAVMIETLAKMEVSAKTANDIIQYMNALPSDLSEQDFSKEMLGIREAYIYGRYGQKYETIESKGFLNDVSDNTRKMFYNRGSVDSMERYSGNKKQYVKSYGGVKFVGNLENNKGKLTAEQNYQIGAVRNIAKHITKNNIVFYESVVNENGERVLDVDLPFRAKGKTAPNGAFTANDGTIYLDVNAGENGEALIMHTFSHEVTHFAAEYSDKFEKLKNFVVNEIVGSGQDFNDLANRKIMQSADEDGNPTLTFATAQEEVIADAMQSMLTNTDAMEKMLALKKVDYDTFGKIKEIFTKLYNKIKELYKNVNPQTYEGRMILEMKESLDKISDLFAEAVVDAGNKYEILAEEVSNEEAFMDSNIAVLNQIRTPYNEGTKAWKEYVDGLNPEAKKVHDIFYNFYTLSKLTNTTNINGKRVKKLNISSVFMTAQTWNQKISEDSQWADAAVKLAESLPDNIRKNMRMNKDGSLEYSELEQKLKMSKSLAQRLVDALGYEKIDNVYDIDGKKVTLATNGVTQSVGGEAYRRALIAETRKLYKEGKLRKVKINTMSKDRWGSLGFLAANGKTTASGDFTTICPQMMFNYGCFYCYRRAALETGVNNKLVAESVWYTGEILRIKDSDVKTLNENGGLRIQSFGDWMPHFSAQLADVLYDAETRGLQVKIITKEPSMIEYVARLRDQGIGKNLYFNISADYVIEAIEGNADNQSGTSLVQPNPARPFMRKDGKYWWKRALSVEEAAGYRAKYPWVNVRIVATDVEEFIRGLKDPNVQVVTGYHGTIRNEKRFDSENGQFKMTVEPIGDAGMPRFNFSNGEWNIEYEGKTKHHKKLANAIEDNNLQQDYYNKSCCITGRCATCLGKCGKVADSFYTKNATNADTESVAYWKEHMTVAEMDESESIEVDMKKSLNQIHRLSDRYFETPTLKTLKGSKIQRSSKYGIGKQMGSQIYVHKNYASEIIPEDVWHEAQRLIEGEFDYNCVMYDTKNPNIVRFDESPDFDTSREPKPGKMMKVDVSTGEIEPAKGNGIPVQLTKSVMGDLLESAYSQKNNGKALYSERDANMKDMQDKVNEFLVEENKKLKADIENLREVIRMQENVIDDRKVTNSSIRKAGSKILENAGIDRGSKEFYDMLTDLYKYIADDGNELLESKAEAIADWVIEHRSKKKTTTISEESSEVLDHLKGKRLRVTEEQKKEIESAYGSYNNFRKMLLGTVTITTKEDAPTIESEWQELAELFPAHFNADDNSHDMPEKLLRTVDSLKASKDIEEYVFASEFDKQDIILDIYGEYWKAATLRSPASKYQKEVNELKAAHAINMQNIRLEHKLEVKRLKDDFRKQFKNAREYYRQKSDEVIQRIRDRQDAMTEKRRTTDVRNKVKRLYKELKDSPWKTKGVTYPEGLVRSVIDICELIDPTGEDQSTKTAKEHWDSMRALQNLRMEYDRMEQAGYEFASEHDKYMSWYIDELSKMVGEKPLRDMNLNEITSVYNVLEEINIALRFATKLLDREEGRSVLDAWEGVIENQKEVQMKGLNKSLKGTQWFNDLIRQWTLNPMRAAYEMTGYDENAELYKLFKDINDGRIKQDFFIMNANKMFESLRETKEGKKLYNDAVEKTIDFGIKDVTGKTVRLSKMQAMQAIMTYERATTNEHQKHLDSPVRFVRVEDAVKGNMGDAFVNGYDVMLTDYVVNKLKNKLESWDKEYMDQAHKLFNEVAKNAINETTLKTKRRIIATDKNYIPYMVNENELNKESEHGNFKASIESSGMLQRLIRDTDTQLVMTGLNDILDEHIKGVGKIYGLSIPVRNWNKIMNLRVKRNSGQKRTTAKDMIANTWHGQKAWKLLSDAVADMQSPRPNNTPVAIQALKSAFVTSTLASNISVTMKQFASYPTAGAVLSGTSLMRASYAFGISGNAMKELWNEIDTYTPQHYFRRLGLSVQELGEMSQSNGWQNKLNNRLGMLSPMNWIQAFDVRTTQALWVASKFDAGKKYAKGTKEYYEYAAELYNKTLEETQPMYDALHRAEVTKNSSMQNFVMFMTQPLQNSGILHEATHGLKANIKKHGANSKQAKEAGEKFRKAVVSQCASHLLFTLMTFAGGVMLHRVNPWRDDDKELTWESFISEYGKEFLENYANAILPFANYVFSGIEKVMGKSSYDVFSAPVIDKINGTLDIMNKQYKSVYDQESGEFVDLTDKSNMSKFFDTSLNTVAEVLSYFGIPGANIKKIADSVKLYKQDIENGDLWKFEAGVDRNKSEKLNRIYRFITEGDKESLDKEVKTFKDESAYMSALVESLVNNDDRVTKAAELRDSGKMSDYKKLVKQIVKEGNFTQDEVVKGVNKVINQMHKDDDDGSSGSSKPVAMFNTSDIANAITGDTSELKTIKKELVSEKVAKGKDKEDARKEVISSIKTKADSLLQSDDIKNSTYKKVLTKYCGKSEEDAELLSKYTKYKGKNPDTEMSTTAYGNYLSIVKDTGLSATEYDAYYGDFKDIKGEDKNGDGKTDAYSTMDNQIAYIDSLDLTPAQKTAFFLATGTKGERSKAAMKRIKW